jgi:hypothetical protein
MVASIKAYFDWIDVPDNEKSTNPHKSVFKVNVDHTCLYLSVYEFFGTFVIMEASVLDRGDGHSFRDLQDTHKAIMLLSSTTIPPYQETPDKKGRE